ncbi:MAG: cytochrome c biogenesis protein CcsA [Candidatus Marinimicrobia bacterium]|nr:cytochrome c biogenesis protein CcsA [Candidatus Neomarinimicrobiota bacterium]MCF7828987.1 cytochrome c biogenesis protein CcsA [Candidatus Neomarinimicrobiota bacterium]MCF7879947.1 cytochrome c biogenesis protein CcsA [Candidatus Neomarinimicrobiota bacterium]
MFVSFLLIAWYAPIESTMGLVQKIFYYHVPSAWVAFLAFGVVFVCSILYLTSKDPKWDTFASSSVEIGVIFALIVLITGPIWARPVWGVWWTWEPRLTTTLILFLIYVAYLLLRYFGEKNEQTAKFAAVLGIIGFIDVPLVYLSINWWSAEAQVHPQRIGMGPEMKVAFFVSLFTFTLLYIYLLIRRVQVADAEKAVDELREIRDE